MAGTGAKSKPSAVRPVALWILFAFLVWTLLRDAWLARLPRYGFRGLLHLEVEWVSVLACLVGLGAIWTSTKLSWIKVAVAGVMVLSLLAVRFAIVDYQLPFRLAFENAVPTLDVLVAEIAEEDAADGLQLDRYVGQFRVYSARTVGDATILRLDDAEGPWNGFYAFVHWPDADGADVDQDLHGLDATFTMPLGDGWFLVANRYFLLKRGWS